MPWPKGKSRPPRAGRPPRESTMNEFENTQPLPADFTQTDEFKAAVSAAAAAATAKILEQLTAARAPDAVVPSDRAFADSLALAIAGLTDQGVGRQARVSPEVIDKRNKARERMMTLIIEAKARGDRPSYQLRNKVWLDEVMVEPVWINPATRGIEPTEIIWPGIPNEAMIPINHPARLIFEAFMDSIGSVVKPVPDEALGVTTGGLVVKGRAVQAKRAVPAAGNQSPGDDISGHEGLSVVHKNKPGQFVEKHILGTVAAPARQTA